MLSQPELEIVLKKLPRPLVGSLSFDHRDAFNLRPACVTMMTEVMALTKPRRILEIGTHLGHSGALLLGFSDADLVSVDIGTNWVTWEHGWADWGIAGGGGLREAVTVIGREFPNRLTFILGDSTSPETVDIIKKYAPYDLAFIDGDHSFDYVDKDIKNAIEMHIPYILLDDCTSPEEDTWRAARANGLALIKHYVSVHNTANIGVGLFGAPVTNRA